MSATAQVEIGDHWLIIREPKPVYSPRMVWIAVIASVLLVFLHPVFLAFTGLYLLVALGVELMSGASWVKIDFQRREIHWHRPHALAYRVWQWLGQPRQLSFSQVANYYNPPFGTWNNQQFLIRLRLLNGKSVVLAVFESDWQRQKVIKALETYFPTVN